MNGGEIVPASSCARYFAIGVVFCFFGFYFPNPWYCCFGVHFLWFAQSRRTDASSAVTFPIYEFVFSIFLDISFI